ncbi:MAG TPA: hypothetical protein VFC72_02560 [Corynebacterium sp.]|nr:hypothetical protein [Corynebacterium sp.]
MTDTGAARGRRLTRLIALRLWPALLVPGGLGGALIWVGVSLPAEGLARLGASLASIGALGIPVALVLSVAALVGVRAHFLPRWLLLGGVLTAALCLLLLLTAPAVTARGAALGLAVGMWLLLVGALAWFGQAMARSG